MTIDGLFEDAAHQPEFVGPVMASAGEAINGCTSLADKNVLFSTPSPNPSGYTSAHSRHKFHVWDFLAAEAVLGL